ncbi:MAG: hypothetical protein ACP5HD_04055 [Thermoproteus sp.]
MGGRRRRRKIIVRPKRTIPKIFVCPNCGAQTVNVKRIGDRYVVICGTCGLREEFEEHPRWTAVDYYNAFVDHFLEGKIKPPEAEQGSGAEATAEGEAEPGEAGGGGAEEEGEGHEGP